MADEGAPTLLKKSAYAAHRGVSPGMVTHWIKGGRLVLVDGMVDVAGSDAALAASVHPTRGGKPDRATNRVATEGKPEGGKPEGASVPTNRFTENRADREHYNAKAAELDYLERVGELVSRERYNRGLADGLGPILASLNSLSARIGPALAGETDVRRVQNILDEAVAKIRQDMADTVQAMIAGNGPTRQ